MKKNASKTPASRILLIGWIAVEVLVTGWIGYSIMNATQHRWARQPQPKLPGRTPKPRQNPMPNGMRQRHGAPISRRNAVAGVILVEAEDLRDENGDPCGIGWTDKDGKFHCDFPA